ncbi:hypothetical protein NDU88_001257 [Pleurodeles waltl]|uniref:Uncharacterized protein n=1 Tax=Pleurodeles waltl TaxID=8319 RepID=A0AAV7Q2K8_PLEWA|nr:hypothetical protein NDU88_001257 [Pleurodeles waltl]
MATRDIVETDDGGSTGSSDNSGEDGRSGARGYYSDGVDGDAGGSSSHVVVAIVAALTVVMVLVGVMRAMPQQETYKKRLCKALLCVLQQGIEHERSDVFYTSPPRKTYTWHCYRESRAVKENMRLAKRLKLSLGQT